MNKFLIVGIGNIGDEYINTRHNIGFLVADKISEILKTPFSSVKLGQRVESSYKGKKVIILKPSNFVNNSGKSLLYWKNKEKIPNKNILVICDDLNLYFGKIKLKSNGSSGGHNGLKDIEEHLKNNNYSRLRVGVLNSKKFNKTDYVLGEWTDKEQDELKNIVNNSVKIALSFIHNGIDQTMNIHNTKNLMDENI
ncbi:MAG TPA: aminoacyl-tRNA hydrolase [Flavobacteriaceae bacterium]|nr:aminoacyl-tRNA hydrolase [Flavobacteriaceae bacterium]MDP7183970.1 aminoacyl-tRNA hydrolase [Flavobacteriaceae bacterium]HJO71165.1 aminoacyl-tRNA hydrolase [Flavobacteriaceae bacterium]